MELKQLINNIKKNKLIFTLIMLLVLSLSVGAYFLPVKYISTGSFYVKREADNSSTFFTYEGYYAQQTALSFTNTVTALLESVDIQSDALKTLNIPVNEQTLRKYSGYIDAKKSGPQLVTLTVKGKSYEDSKSLWHAMSNSLLTTTKDIANGGDMKLTISKVSEDPVVKTSFRSIWINIILGLIIGKITAILYITFKEYLKD